LKKGEGMVLDIVEVSQKQAYIFSSNKLKENVERSAQIAWVTSSAFFEKHCGMCYKEEENLVYAGGGHTVLCFTNESAAKAFNKELSIAILKLYPNMEIFVKLNPYDDSRSPGDNLKELTKALEKKKSIRRSSFRHGTFGFEKINRNTLEPVRRQDRMADEDNILEIEEKTDKQMIPDEFRNVLKFEDLGGSKGVTNFVAVVHIDGNGMGARVNELYKKLEKDNLPWDQFRKKIREFSDSIDFDYKTAYKEMLEYIVSSKAIDELSIDDKYLPIRRIITSGDDICFVAEGRIGIEAARIYIDRLSAKKNAVDGKRYSACAGVSIVHVKYPFFMAYELAESLCNNAKRLGAEISPEDNGSSVSSIDWHIAYGELKNSLNEERESYKSIEGAALCARPYVISGGDGKDSVRKYDDFVRMVKTVRSTGDSAARRKIKALRNVLKQTDEEIRYYRDFNHLERLMETDKAVLFDAIEVMDTFIRVTQED